MKTGRPRKPKAEKLTAVINIALKPADRQALENVRIERGSSSAADVARSFILQGLRACRADM